MSSVKGKTNIPVLRSRLQHECNELKCLTDSELGECKWSIKKSIYLQLFTISPSLRELSEELQDLQETRNVEVGLNKGKTVDRSIRQEEEMYFRTKFLDIIISGLTKLRWPPTLVAFSDSKDLLFNDSASVLDSFQFILNVAVPKSTNRFDRDTSFSSPPHQHQQSFSNDIHNSPEKQLTPPPKPLSFAEESALSSSGGRRKSPHSSQSRPQKTPFVAGTNSIEISGGEFDSSEEVGLLELNRLSLSGERRAGSAKIQDSSRQSISSLQSNQSNAPSDYMRREPPMSARSIRTSGGMSVSSSRSTATNKYGTVQPPTQREEFSMQAFEILQSQNEALKKKLKMISDSASARDAVQSRVSGILADLKVTVRDIAQVSGGGGGAGKAIGKNGGEDGDTSSSFIRSSGVTTSTASNKSTKTTTAGATDDHSLNDAETALFQQEVLREEARRGAGKNRSMGVHSVVDTTESDVSSTHLLCSKCRGPLKPPSGLVSSSVVQKALHHKQEIALPASSVIWSRLHAKIVSLEAQWVEALRSSSEAHNAPVPVHALSFDQFTVSAAQRLSPSKKGGSPGGYASSARGSTVASSRAFSVSAGPTGGLVRQTLGVSRGGVAVDEEEETDHGLDLSRVHQLQRDLVSFSDRAFDLLCGTGDGLSVDNADDETEVGGEGFATLSTSNLSRLNGDDKTPRNGGGAKNPLNTLAATRRSIAALQSSACQLLLHLACLAPLAPLAVDAPYSSSMTGLESFVQETLSLLGAKASKSTLVKLQAAADRAQSEQVAVIRCLVASRAGLRQWCDFSDKMTPRLVKLGAKYHHMVDRSVAEIERQSSAVTSILSAYSEAEGVRMVMSGGGAAGLTSANLGEINNNINSGGGNGHISSSGSVSSTSTSSSRRLPVHPGPAAVSPLESLMRGSAGREVGALLLALKMHRDDLAELPEQLSALGQKLKSECRAESELVNALRANLQHAAELTTKGANSSVTGTPRNISSSSSEVSDLQKRHSNSSSRNREAARSNPNAINSTIQGAAYGTPRTASQVKRQQWDSGTSIS